MRGAWLAIALAIILVPSLAQAGIEIVIAGVTISISAASIAAAVVSAALSLLTSLVFRPEEPRPPFRRNKLNEIEGAPVYTKCYGTLYRGGYVTERRVKGDILFMQLMVQSDRSIGPFSFFINDRAIPVEGDPFDFDGPGAQSFDPELPDVFPDAELYDGLVTFWMGLGDQSTVPAQLLDEEPKLAEAPIWPGFTVVWGRFKFGDQGRSRDRYPDGVPLVNVEGQFSPVWDPRDPAQDPDDPDTWRFSANQALCKLDMIRNPNCFDAPLSSINIPSFIEGANICDRQVRKKGGGKEALYRVGGAWRTEGKAPFEIIKPCMDAGMSDLVEVDGQWRYVPGAYRAPEFTLSGDDIIGEEAVFDFERDPADLINSARVSFVSPPHNWDLQPLEDIVDEAALSADGGVNSWASIQLDWVTSIDQAYRIAWRTIQITRLERQCTGVFGGRALKAHVEAPLFLEIPALYDAPVEMVCKGWSLGFDQVDDTLGIARMTIPMTLVETGPQWDLFDADARPDLEEIIEDDPVKAVDTPNLLAVTGIETDGQTTGATIELEQSLSASVTAYNVSYRPNLGGGNFGTSVALPSILVEDLGGGDRIIFSIDGLVAGDYQAVVRAVSFRGLSAPALTTFAIAPSGEIPDPPSLISASTGTNHRPIFRVPNDARASVLVVYRNDEIFAELFVDPLDEITVEGSGPGDREYFARTRSIFGVLSDPSASSTHNSSAGDQGK
ncbi:MAG: phage tail protein [Pseudomonadota bacterium]